MLNTFSCTCWLSVCPLQKTCVLRPSAHFLIWLVFIFFFCYWVIGVLCIFWILIPYQIHNMQILSPFCRLPFHFVDEEAFSVQKLFIMMLSHLFLLLMPLLSVSDPKDHCQDQCYGVYGLCFLQEFYDPRYYLQVLNFELILHSWKRIHQPAIFLQFFFCTLVSDGGGICVTRIKWLGMYVSL